MPSGARRHVAARMLGTTAVLAGCSLPGSASGHGITLELPGGHDISESTSRAETGVAYSYGSMIVCLAAPGSVILDQVQLEKADSIAVRDFRVRPNPYRTVRGTGLDSDQTTLEAAGFTSPRHTVDEACNGSGAGYELGIQVVASDLPASSNAFLVHYRSGGRSRVLRIPRAIQLEAGPGG